MPRNPTNLLGPLLRAADGIRRRRPAIAIRRPRSRPGRAGFGTHVAGSSAVLAPELRTMATISIGVARPCRTQRSDPRRGSCSKPPIRALLRGPRSERPQSASHATRLENRAFPAEPAQAMAGSSAPLPPARARFPPAAQGKEFDRKRQTPSPSRRPAGGRWAERRKGASYVEEAQRKMKNTRKTPFARSAGLLWMLICPYSAARGLPIVGQQIQLGTSRQHCIGA